MSVVPKIKLAVDLNKLDRYFSVNDMLKEGFDYNITIDRQKYDVTAALLGEYDIMEKKVILEFCFLLMWMEKETGTGKNMDHISGKYSRMWAEVDHLKQYLLKNRITAVILRGEFEKNEPDEDLLLKEEINIDRICDGLRTVFREEFNYDNQKRRSKGQKAWMKRKMIRIRNNWLNYFTTIPKLDRLSLEEQTHLIDRLSGLAGITVTS